MADAPELAVCFDGASRGNPGKAAIGVVVLRNGVPVKEISETIGEATNNVAEYRALLRGLEEAEALGARRVQILSDSELVVRQLSGRYRVRSAALAVLYRDALTRLRKFDRVSIRHVPRTENRGADALANRALDELAATSSESGQRTP